MTERELTTDALKRLKEWGFTSCAVEFKVCKGTSLPFNALAPHQRQSLLHVKHGFVAFKIPDFGGQNPFDAFVLTELPAWVCVIFYTPRKHKEVVFIDIDRWGAEEMKNERKSITKARALEIGVMHSM